MESGKVPREVGAESVIVVVFGFGFDVDLVMLLLDIGWFCPQTHNNLFRQLGVLAQLARISKGTRPISARRVPMKH